MVDMKATTMFTPTQQVGIDEQPHDFVCYLLTPVPLVACCNTYRLDGFFDLTRAFFICIWNIIVFIHIHISVCN
jgi:hypothetical protein